MRLKLEVLALNLQSDKGSDQPQNSVHEILPSVVEVKVKTKWAYLALPVSTNADSNSPTSITLPSYIPSSKEESLVLFIEFWRNGHFQGLSEFNIRGLLGKQPGEDLVKWLQIWCPITNKVRGKLMLRLEDEDREEVSRPLVEPNRLGPDRTDLGTERPSTVQPSDTESRNTRRPSTPMSSSYFPSSASGSPMTSMSSSASTVTILTAQSSPSKARRRSPEMGEWDIIEILNKKMELLGGSYEGSKGNNWVTQRSAGSRKGSQQLSTISKSPTKAGANIPQTATLGQSSNSWSGGRSEAIMAVVKVQDSSGQGQLKKRRMAANFTHSPPPQATNRKTSKQIAGTYGQKIKEIQ